MSEYKSEIKFVPLDTIVSDLRVNPRTVDARWVDRKLRSEGWQSHRAGVPQLSERPSGYRTYVDGQNRAALAKAAGAEEIEARVFYGLSLEQEADLFLALNSNRYNKPIQKFNARLTAGHADALDISRVCSDLGFRPTGDLNTPGAIAAVSALERVYHGGVSRGGGASSEGASTLSGVLAVLRGAFGSDRAAVKAELLLGVAAVVRRHRGEIDLDALTQRLAATPGGAPGLYGLGKGVQQVLGVSASDGVARKVVDLYNQRRKGGKLPPWS